MDGQRSMLHVVLLLLVLAFSAACNPIYYSPNTQNVLIDPVAGEFAALAATDGNRIELQAAYAASDAIAVQVNAGFFERDDLDNGDGGSGNFLEAGVGYVVPLSPAFVAELHALAGYGSFENHFPSSVQNNPGTSGEISGKLVRLGIQPALGYRSRYLEAALSSRLASMRYQDVDGALVYAGEDQVAYLRDGGSYVLLEPALTLRAGPERVKVQVQLGGSINLTDEDFRQDDSMLTVGIRFGGPLR